MSIDLIVNIMQLDNNVDLHSARLLVLMTTLSSKKRRVTISGITKLVKLDFLLRYPTVLETALNKMGLPTTLVEVQPYERDSVESKMVRYKYGPWDHRYRLFLSVLESKGLVYISSTDGTVDIQITDLGYEVGCKLLELDSLQDYVSRSKIIKMYFGDWSATRLKEFMYELIPQLSAMQLGAEIKP